MNTQLLRVTGATMRRGPIAAAACFLVLTAAGCGGSGDGDLYVRYGSQPTTSSYDCRPYRWGNDESCSISNPQAGTWYISIRGYNSYSGVTLQAEAAP